VRGTLPALIAVVALLAGCAAPEPVWPDQRPDLVVRATVDRSLVEAGDVVTYTVELDWAEGVTPAVPEFGRNIEGLRVEDQRFEGPDEIDGRMTEVFTYELVADKPGSYELPGVEVPYTTEGGEQGTAGTGMILVEARAKTEREVDPDDPDAPPVILDEQLRDIVGTQNIPDPNLALWLVILGGLFLAVVGGWVFVVYGRWSAPPLPSPPPPAHVIALRQLEALRGKGLLADGEYQAFAFGLSEIFRTYLGARFAFPAVEWTTTEILQGLPERLQALRREAEIRQVLDATDFVKYAGRSMDPSELDRLADVCQDLVQQTRPVEGEAGDDEVMP